MNKHYHFSFLPLLPAFPPTTRCLHPSTSPQLTTDPDGEFDFGFGPFSSTNKTKRNKTAKSKTGKWADDVGVTIKSAKILPNTWKPK